MTWLIEALTNLWAPFAALAGGILFILFQRWRIKKKNELIDRQEQVIQAHERIEEVHKQDQTLESEADKKINELREKVNEAKTPEEGAQTVADELNEYFRGKDK